MDRRYRDFIPGNRCPHSFGSKAGQAGSGGQSEQTVSGGMCVGVMHAMTIALYFNPGLRCNFACFALLAA